jgi:hydrogenase assembly chaperone HypC/HupF
MCLVLPARVVAVHADEVEIELPGGMRARAGLTLCPAVAVGQYVLVDRGLALKVIESAEAEAILALYDEIGQLLEAEGEGGLALTPAGPDPLAAWLDEGRHA